MVSNLGLILTLSGISHNYMRGGRKIGMGNGCHERFSDVQFNKSIAWANTTEHNEQLSISLPDNTEMESKGKYCQFPAIVRRANNIH